ncbi:triacylglycerol lipase 2 isoform X1 [Beta vulgaris subsp. vulgaris]|uniref:triacylglycerol lipase 2 isoform X1 n=1 Tax=Beta vulgaris subsp. vulgaris TaxID=3555 RepID=UPI00053FDA42|nr:triacylglycerol lipase 2 isoform X1 [Beta vulgaris subsp. vulgaris]
MPDTVAFSLCLSYQQKFNDIYWLLVFFTSNRMTGILSLLVLVSFFFQNNTVRATRTLIVTETRDQLLALAPSSDAGICKLLVESRGYVCEEHTVTTKDGYILSLQRIPSGLTGDATRDSRSPVLLQHGVLMDGVTWLLNPPDQSLAFILADSGFDVWIANSRGTTYSLGHITLSSNDSAYWDWSWDELMAYDLLAIVQYVYDQSGEQKLHYVGHSQGTLIALTAFSQKKLLNMVRSAGLLCPIAYLSRMTSPLAKSAAENFVTEILYWSGLHEFVPRGEAVMKLLKDICRKQGIDCTDFLTSFTGANCCLSTSTVSTFLKHEPQPTATKNMIHFSQMARDGTIARYDYLDVTMNMERYGQAKPPVYDLTDIPNNLPLFIAHGGRDELADVDDVKFLLDNLKNHDKDKLYLQFIEDYAHADYVLAMNAKKFVYDPLIDFLRKQDDS